MPIAMAFTVALYFSSNLELLDTSAIYEQLYTTAEKVLFPAHGTIHQNVTKNAKIELHSSFDVLEQLKT